MFQTKTVDIGNYKVVVSSGGVSVVGMTGDFTCSQTQPPQNMNNKDEVQQCAEKGLAEYRKFWGIEDEDLA